MGQEGSLTIEDKSSEEENGSDAYSEESRSSDESSSSEEDGSGSSSEEETSTGEDYLTLILDDVSNIGGESGNDEGSYIVD